MKIGVFGAGYVGLVLSAGLAELGNDIICVDVDKKKITLLKKGIIPIYEPELKEIVDRNVKEGRLKFTTNTQITIKNSDVIFIAVGTPSKKDGSVELKYVDSVAKEIGRDMQSYKLIVDKSTVPVGTAERVKKIIKQNQKKKINFDIASNPEFLREGSAIKDFFDQDRIIIGVETEKAKEILHSIFKTLERANKPMVFTDIKSAEMIKYASNAFLATKISFINEVSRLCEKVGADVKTVAKGMGLDQRIGPRFLQAGVGYGGSCFPKDVRGFIKTAQQNKLDFKILKAVDKVNEEQKLSVIPKVKKLVGNLKGKTIAVWGIAFKPKTDDLREAPALVIIKKLQKQGAKINAFDPVAMENAKKVLTKVKFCKNPYETAKNADCLVIVTEWNEFRELDKEKIRNLMKQPNVVDGRNIYDPEEMKNLGFNYVCIGR